MVLSDGSARVLSAGLMIKAYCPAGIFEKSSVVEPWRLDLNEPEAT